MRVKAKSEAAGERIDAWLGTRAAGWVLLALVAALYAWAYWQDPLNPGATPAAERQGWWSWSDQMKYFESAAALAEGRIDRESYYYPLGYGALGAPFVRVMPGHPFFWPDLFFVLVAAALAWRLARRWFGPLAAAALAALFIVTHAALLRLTLVIPWNTIPVQAAFFAAFWLVLTRRDGRAVAWLAVVAAAVYFTRPIDAACLAPVLVWATLRLPTWRERIGWGALGVTIVAAAVFAVGWINLRTFGQWRTPYEQGSFANIGFFSFPVTHKLYALLVDGETFFGEYGSALLWRYPWLFLAVPGVVWWIRRDGAAAAACLATLGLNWALYFNYNDFLPSAVYRFSLIHYISWAFVPLALAAAGAVTFGWRNPAVRRAAVAMVACFAVAIGLKLKERELPVDVGPGEVRALPEHRPLWVRFPGEKLEAAHLLELDGRRLAESADFQMPYVPTDLRVLLCERAVGRRLSAERAGVRATPVVGDFEWSWWPRWRRLRPPRD